MSRFNQVIEAVEKNCRERSIFMLGPEKARFLTRIVVHASPELVVECGTAIGYSGLHILSVLKTKGSGKLITIEIDPNRAREAQKNFLQADAGGLVDVRVGDAVDILKTITQTVDFLLLDNHWGNYLPSFLAIQPRLRDGATIVADNAGIGAGEMVRYLSWMRNHYDSHAYWFETDLPWAGWDAMEVTIYQK